MIRLIGLIMKEEARNKDTTRNLFNFFRVMHTLGVRVLAIWLKTVVYCVRGNLTTANFCMSKAYEEIEANYNVD